MTFTIGVYITANCPPLMRGGFADTTMGEPSATARRGWLGLTALPSLVATLRLPLPLSLSLPLPLSLSLLAPRLRRLRHALALRHVLLARLRHLLRSLG